MRPVWNLTWTDTETARVVWEQPDAVELHFARISETVRADAVTAIIEVHTQIAEIGRVAGPIRINLYSSSAIDGLRRACQNVTDFPDWAKIIGDSFAAVLEGYGIPEGTDIDLDAPATPQRWLLEPFLEAVGYTVLYARGGSGKSYLGAAACVTVATGEPILGLTPATTGPCAYLDWEADSQTLNHRVQRLCLGAGVGSLQHPIRHYAMSGPFAARRASLGPALSRLDPELIVIDSKGLATTGAPESSEGILDLARALRYLDAPVLLIDHISKGAIKGDDPDMAFGSQYVEAAARLAWSLKTEYKPGSMVLHLRNTKANNHRRADPLAMELMFAGDAVTVMSTSVMPPTDSDADLPKHYPAIFDWLAENGPAKQADIAKALDLHDRQVSRVLNDEAGTSPGFRKDGDLWTVWTPPDELPF